MKTEKSGKTSVKKTMLILVFSILILAISGILLSMFIRLATRTFREEIKLTLDGTDRTEQFTVEALDLTPGNSKQCDLIFDSQVHTQVIVSLGFDEKEVGTLRDFVQVKVTYNDTQYSETMLLKEFFEGGTVVQVPMSVEIGERYIISITYSMPEEIGNEAQGAWSDFNLVLSTAFAP